MSDETPTNQTASNWILVVPVLLVNNNITFDFYSIIAITKVLLVHK